MMNYHFVGNSRHGDKKHFGLPWFIPRKAVYINAREYVYLKYCTPVALIVCVCVCVCMQNIETTK